MSGKDNPGTTEVEGSLIPNWVSILLALFSLFQLYTAGFGAFQSYIQRSVHLGLALVLAIVIYSPNYRRKIKLVKTSITDYTLIAMAVVTISFVVINATRFLHSPFSSSSIEVVFTFLIIICVLEAARRSIGLAMPILAILGIAYAFLGSSIPGIWGHSGISPTQFAEVVYMSNRGLWGQIIAISSTVIASFIIFGAMLYHTGGSQVIMDLILVLTGRAVGGPAKVSAIASGLFGMISGSPAANVAITGSVTIPLMKRLGYKPEFAAGVEAAASTGGLIMPPIMGAAAFLMAEFLGIPYTSIIVAAIIPAFLYYWVMWWSVHFFTSRYALKGLSETEIPKWSVFLTPIPIAQVLAPAVLLVYLLFAGRTPMYAGFWATVLVCVVFFFNNSQVKGIRDKVRLIGTALVDAGKSLSLIAVISGAAQLVVIMLTLTGISIKFSELILSIGSSTLLLALLVGALLCLILGMGMPAVAAYVLGSVIAAPALTKLGVDPLAAHMFIFFMTTFANITPPVCSSVFVAAPMAQAKWFPAAVYACRLGIAAFIIPFQFVYFQELLLRGDLIDILTSLATAAIGCWALSAASMGYLFKRNNIVDTVLLGGGALLLITPGYMTDLIGFVLVIIVGFWQVMIARFSNKGRKASYSQIKN